MSLTVDGTLVVLLPGPAGLAEERVPFFVVERLPGGRLRSSHSTERDRKRRWSVQTPPRARATVQAWETALRAPGLKIASGYPVGGGTVECYARAVRRTQTQVLDRLALSFRLEEG